MVATVTGRVYSEHLQKVLLDGEALSRCSFRLVNLWSAQVQAPLGFYLLVLFLLAHFCKMRTQLRWEESAGAGQHTTVPACARLAGALCPELPAAVAESSGGFHLGWFQPAGVCVG